MIPAAHRAWLAGLSRDTLLALANPGLLRRAEKAVEEASPPQSNGTALSVRVGEFDVTLGAEGPQAARCPCPAPAICIHILAAFLKAQAALPMAAEAEDRPATSPTAPDPLAALLATPFEALRSLAGGLPALRRAWRLAQELTVSVAPEPGALRLTLDRPPLSVRWLTGAGAAGMVSRAGADAPLLHSAAILALQRDAGCAPAELAGGEARLPVLQPEALEGLVRLQMLLEDLVLQGLAAVPQARFGALARTIPMLQAAELHRLARSLRGALRRLAGLAAARADAPPGAVLSAMAHCAALAAALAQAAPEALPPLQGRSRSNYTELPPTALLPIARTGWSGRDSAGMRFLFWAPETGQFMDWARVDRAHGRDIAVLTGFDADGFDAALGRQRWMLHGGRIGADGRLALPQAAQPVLAGPLALVPERLPWLDSVAAIDAALRPLRPLGLAPLPGLATMRWLRGFAWSAPQVDALDPAVTVTLTDRDGATLPLRLAWSADHAARARALYRLPAAADPATAPGLVVQLAHRGGLWVGEPVALVQQDRVLPLEAVAPPAPVAALEALDATTLHATMEDDDAEVGAADPPTEWGDPLAAALLGLRMALVDIALAGTARQHGSTARQSLLRHAETCDRLGLVTLAASARATAAEAGAPAALLRCCFAVDTALALM